MAKNLLYIAYRVVAPSLCGEIIRTFKILDLSSALNLRTSTVPLCSLVIHPRTSRHTTCRSKTIFRFRALRKNYPFPATQAPNFSSASSLPQILRPSKPGAPTFELRCHVSRKHFQVKMHQSYYMYMLGKNRSTFLLSINTWSVRLDATY